MSATVPAAAKSQSPVNPDALIAQDLQAKEQAIRSEYVKSGFDEALCERRYSVLCLDDKVLAQISPLKESSFSLDLQGVSVTAAVILQIAKTCPKISGLLVEQLRNDAREVIKEIAKFTELRSLVLSGPHSFPGESKGLFQPLASLKKLESLALRFNLYPGECASVKDLAPLQQLPSLQTLDVSNAACCLDKAEEARVFAAIPNLTTLIAKDCHVLSKEFIDELKRLKPNITIITDASPGRDNFLQDFKWQ